jgi:RecA/RadA recombinase
MTDFMKDLISEMGKENMYVADENLHSGELTGVIDTGSLILNGLLSGSIFGGAPANKILELAGEPTTGKTFFALGIAKRFLDERPGSCVIYYDTEAAVSNATLRARGIDPARVIFVETSAT